MKSVLLVDDAAFDEWDIKYDETSPKTGDYEHKVYSNGETTDFSYTTNAGQEALRVSTIRYVSVLYAAKLALSPRFPAFGSKEEPLWLRKCRTTYGAYQPDDEDRASLESVSHFEFEIKEFDLELKKLSRYVPEELRDKDEMMVILEGLRWGEHYRDVILHYFARAECRARSRY